MLPSAGSGSPTPSDLRMTRIFGRVQGKTSTSVSVWCERAMYTTYGTYMFCVFVCRFSQKLQIGIARTGPDTLNYVNLLYTFMCMYICRYKVHGNVAVVALQYAQQTWH